MLFGKLRTGLILLLFIWVRVQPVYSQGDSLPHDTLHLFKGRLAAAISVQSALAVGTLIGLNDLWYADYPRSSFHLFNDNKEWLKMDKCGHAFSAYQLSRVSTSTFRWTGLKESTSVWCGTSTGFAYQLIIEILDGYSAQWGFSWGDFVANVSGCALYAGQQFAWHEQRFLPKFSYHYTKYAAMRPEMLGGNAMERVLKDYNGQTYWLSVAPGAFLKKENRFPKWIAVSFGYSAEGMLGAESNNIDAYPQYSSIPRNSRFLLSLDVDFSRIPFKNKTLRTIFSLINTLKVPFSAIEYNSGSGFKGHWMYL